MLQLLGFLYSNLYSHQPPRCVKFKNNHYSLVCIKSLYWLSYFCTVYKKIIENRRKHLINRLHYYSTSNSKIRFVMLLLVTALIGNKNITFNYALKLVIQID
uniref:Uncharacterized protein n=1 Tax=Sipha flava TaxID=143950 RepID=A0A2S2Q2L7_9HEMI